MRLLVMFLVFACLSCARVDVQTSKPIKMDINMRVDVYQHVVKEVGSLEDEIYGSSGEQLNGVFGFCSTAYAADVDGQLRAVVESRKERGSQIESLMNQGVVGEKVKIIIVGPARILECPEEGQGLVFFRHLGTQYSQRVTGS